MFTYEPLQALNAQNSPMAFISFQPRETPNLKEWSISVNYMRQKQHQERHVKSERLRVSRLHFGSTLGTSIATPSDRKQKCSTNSPPDGPWKTLWKTTME